VKKIVEESLAFAEASPWPEGPEAMEDLYATPVPEE
jgi:TPP-dependent pyruvate/acetoin dehydrogenase alpha subunit